MTSNGKHNVLGVLVDAVDYKIAVAKIIDAAKSRAPFAVTALAVHGVMTGVQEQTHRYRLNHLDLVTADGQPVRWALNLLHRAGAEDRVYGPTLMAKVCEAAIRERLPIYLYGSTPEVLAQLVSNLQVRFPALEIAGAEPSKFRRTTTDEKYEIAQRIRRSGARITFVGLGCPRQEVFAYEYRNDLDMPVVAVGAAFDYHSGILREPSERVQRLGLQWAYRFLQEPRRLWKRYLLLNPAYLTLLLAQKIGIWRPEPRVHRSPKSPMLYG